MGNGAARLCRATLAALFAVLAAACGGGGDTAAPPVQTPVADARNGDYVAVAANAREYTLSVDFDARTYRMNGNGLSESGAIAADVTGFHFVPTSPGLSTGTVRFTASEDGVIGGFRFPEGVLPFVAARQFVTTLSQAAGSYNFLSRTVDTAAPPNIEIFQGEITAGGQLRTCMDLTIYTIAQCPASSVITGTLTFANDTFTSTTPTGAFPFRIARIGSDRIFIRGSPSSATARRFWVGTPATTSFAAATFSGANTSGNWSTVGLSSAAHSATLLTATGSTFNRSGAARAANTDPALGGLLVLDTADAFYFAIRASGLAVIAASRDSATARGFMEIVRAQ